MDNNDKTIGIGIYRRRDNILGECVHVVPMQWSERDGRPIGVGSRYDFAYLDDLTFSGWVGDFMSDTSANEPDWPYYHGSEAEYESVHRVDARRAKVMSDFLTKVSKAMEKAHAREAGDRFAVFAACIKAQKVWVAKGPDHTDIRQFVQYSVVEGRDIYRRMIAEAKAAMRKRLVPQAA